MQAFQKMKRRLTSDDSGVPPWGAELPFFYGRKCNIGIGKKDLMPDAS
jgi:hypothetical protein